MGIFPSCRMKTFLREHIELIIFFVAGFVLYANVIGGDFVYEDRMIVWDNISIRSPQGIAASFLQTMKYGDRIDYRFYRPFYLFTFFANYSLHKLNVYGYHIVNILLHIAVVMFFYRFVFLLLKDKAAAFLAALFFLIHPVVIEPVSYVAGRVDSLAALFILLAMICYVRLCEQGALKYRILFPLFYILAVLSKETGAMILGLVVLYHFAYGKKTRWDTLVPAVSLFLLYLLFWFNLVGKQLLNVRSGPEIFLRGPGLFVALLRYLRIIIVPYPIHRGYDRAVFSFFHPQVLLGALLMMGCLFIFFQSRRHKPIVTFALGWFFICLLPVLGLFPLSAFMYVHWLYTPMLGVAMLFGWGMQRWLLISSRSRMVRWLLAVIFLVYAGLTMYQNQAWRDEETFYQWMIKTAPESSLSLAGAGMVAENRGRKEEALGFYQKLVELYPRDIRGYLHIANIYEGEGRLDDAVEYYRRAIIVNPRLPIGYQRLADLYAGRGEWFLALYYYKKILEIAPGDSIVSIRLARIYRKLRIPQEGLKVLLVAFKRNPLNPLIIHELGIEYKMRGRREEALSYFQRALALDSQQVETYFELGNFYREQGAQDEAMAFYQQGLDLYPDFALGHAILAVVYHEQGDEQQARHHYLAAKNLGYPSAELDRIFEE